MAEAARLAVEWALAANAALLLVTLALLILEAAIAHTPLARAWGLRRTLNATAWALVALLPVLALAPALPEAPVNATDLVVAQYLKGNLALSASELSALIDLRGEVAAALMDRAEPLWRLVAGALAAGALLRGAHVAVTALRLRGLLSRARVLRRAPGLRVLASPEVDVPFATRGLRRRYVVLPAALLGTPALRIALAHEMQHLRQGDATVEVALSLVSPLFALNPAFWALARRTRRLREHGCDAACVARPGIDARAYALCLLDVARATRGGARQGSFSVPFLGRRQIGPGRSQLAQRIEALCARPAAARPGIAALLAVALVAAAAGGTWTLRAPGSWSHERLMLSSVTNLERLRARDTARTPVW